MNPDIKKLAPLLTTDNIQRAVQQNAITPQDLTGNQKALTVPPAPTPTAGAPIDAYSSLAVETKKAEEEASAARSTGQADLEATLQELMNVPSQRAALEQQAGLAEKQTAYNEYTDQLETEQRTLKKQQDAIYSNPMLTREQAQQQFGEIQRLSLSKQADIAVLQSISSRDLTRAQDTIDKKIQNILEPLQMKYDFQKMFYQENREDLTKAQDRQFRVKLAESENTIAQSKATLDTIKDLVTTAAQNGAPQSVINGILKAQTAGDLVTAQRLAAPYMVNPLDQELKRAQIASANRANQPSGGGIGGGFGSLNLSATQKSDLVDIQTLQEQISSIENLASDGSLAGIGGFGLGSLKQSVFKTTGKGSDEGAKVRTTIGNIKAQIAKLRGGTSFTTNEEKLLDSYVPGINESTASVLAKLSGLKSFLQSKQNAIITVGGGTLQDQDITRPEDLRSKYNY